MEADFNRRNTKVSPFLDKAVKERTAREPGTTDIPTRPRATWVEPAVRRYKTKMARNCEKKLIGLNRLWLAKQQKGLILYWF